MRQVAKKMSLWLPPIKRLVNSAILRLRNEPSFKRN